MTLGGRDLRLSLTTGHAGEDVRAVEARATTVGRTMLLGRPPFLRVNQVEGELRGAFIDSGVGLTSRRHLPPDGANGVNL